MVLKYEFGGDDYEPGEEYEVNSCTVFNAILRRMFGYNYAVVKKYLGDYIDMDAFIEDHKDEAKEAFEGEARQAWKYSKR